MFAVAHDVCLDWLRCLAVCHLTLLDVPLSDELAETETPQMCARMKCLLQYLLRKKLSLYM